MKCKRCGFKHPARTQNPAGERLPYWRNEPAALNQLIHRRPDLADFPGLGARLTAAFKENA